MGNLPALKLHCTLDVPVENMISIFYEIPHYQKWMPFIKRSENLKNVTKFLKEAFMRADLPFINDREIYLFGGGINRMKEKRKFYIIAKSIDEDNEYLNFTKLKIEKHSKTVRADVKYFFGEFRPITKNKIEMTVVTLIDPKLNFLP